MESRVFFVIVVNKNGIACVFKCVHGHVYVHGDLFMSFPIPSVLGESTWTQVFCQISQASSKPSNASHENRVTQHSLPSVLSLPVFSWASLQK